jgi:hypothetical protein
MLLLIVFVHDTPGPQLVVESMSTQILDFDACAAAVYHIDTMYSGSFHAPMAYCVSLEPAEPSNKE